MRQRESLISTRSLAKMLGVKPAVVYSLVRHKRIPFYRVGGRYRFDEKEVLVHLHEFGGSENLEIEKNPG